MLTFIKALVEKHTTLAIAICTLVDIAGWMYFKSDVKKLAEQYEFSFETKPTYYLNFISLLLIFVLALLVFMEKIQIDMDVIDFAKGGAAKLGQSPAVSEEDVIGFCSNCGNKLIYDNKFCISCGTPIPEDILRAAEESHSVEKKQETANAVGFCSSCGSRVTPGSLFCENCGAKLD